MANDVLQLSWIKKKETKTYCFYLQILIHCFYFNDCFLFCIKYNYCFIYIENNVYE